MKEKELEKVLKALANRRRLAIVMYLKQSGEDTVGGIAEYIKLSFKATSKHLGVLSGANILEKEQRSLQMWYKLSPMLHPVVKLISNSPAYAISYGKASANGRIVGVVR